MRDELHISSTINLQLDRYKRLSSSRSLCPGSEEGDRYKVTDGGYSVDCDFTFHSAAAPHQK